MMLEKWQINVIEKALTDGERVELIPVKDGVKVMKISRKEIKNTSK